MTRSSAHASGGAKNHGFAIDVLLERFADPVEETFGSFDVLLDGLTGQDDKNASNDGSGGKTGDKNGEKSGSGNNLIDDTVGAVEDVLDLLDDPLAP